MKVLTLLGSARKKGNTATVLGWVGEELKAAGHTVERINFNAKRSKAAWGVPNAVIIPTKSPVSRRTIGMVIDVEEFDI